MTTIRIISTLLLLLISLVSADAQAGDAGTAFADPLARRGPFPVPPGAVPDQGYARLARYVVAFMYGLDERTQQVDAWYSGERLEAVRGFYADTFGHAFACETVDHPEFIHQHRSLFKDSTFADAEGVYEHCVSGRVDLFSPVYNYALQTWQAGTMVVLRR